MTATEWLFGLAMAVGLVGVLLPVLPGLLLIAVVAVLWGTEVATTQGWVVVGVMLAILLIGTVLKYRMPGREMLEQEVPPLTWLLAGVGGIIGFFAIPVLGLALGFVVGTYLGEWARYRAHGRAWSSAKRVVTSIAKGMGVEFAAGVVAIVVWAIAALNM